MVSLVSLARPYARAVFAEALAVGELPLWQQRLSMLAEVLDDVALRPIVRSRAIPSELKLQAIVSAADTDVGLVNLVTLLVKNNRLELVSEIAKQFAVLVRDQEQKQVVTIISPYPLEKASLKAIVERLSERTGKQLEVETQIEPTLIAGIQIRGQGWLIEGNMRAQLTHLSRQLIA